MPAGRMVKVYTAPTARRPGKVTHSNKLYKSLGLATRPKMMSKYKKLKRSYGTDTQVFYFKLNEALPFQSNITKDFTLDDMYNITQFRQVLPLYEQFKVLGFQLKMIPANPYTENIDIPGPARGLYRGNGILLLDQDFKTDGTQDPPIQHIRDVINSASCKIINMLRTQYRSIWRPFGQSGYTPTAADAQGLVLQVDKWSPAIRYFVQDSSSEPAFDQWFVTVQYKVLFRARKQEN